MNNFEYKNKQ